MGHRASRVRAESRAAVPRWRRARPGWMFLHVLFGLGLLGLTHIVLAGLVILEVRAPGADPASRNRLVSWAALGAGIALTFLGWLLFVYLRRSRAARWGLLMALVGLGAAVNMAGQLVAEGVLLPA